MGRRCPYDDAHDAGAAGRGRRLDRRAACPRRTTPRRRGGRGVELGAEGPSALAGAQDGVDLVVLDLGLPGMDGLDGCRELRANGSEVPVLVLTARADEVDTVVGLDAGADDYVTKPFRLAELLARARALLRRGSHEVAASGELVRIDSEGRRAWFKGEELQLTAKEFDLL